MQLNAFAASKQRSPAAEELQEDSPLPFAALSVIYAALGIAIYAAPHSVGLQCHLHQRCWVVAADLDADPAACKAADCKSGVYSRS